MAGEEVTSRCRNLFGFDLSGITAAVTSATANLHSPKNPDRLFDGYQSGDLFETHGRDDVSTDAAVLASRSGGIAAFEDTGTGTSGSYDVSAADNGQFVSMTLDKGALIDVYNTSGLFAIGGTISTIDLTPDNEIILASSGEPSVPAPNLVLTTVPVPAAVWLFGTGLVGLIGIDRRKKS